ncbi:hypothetical protein ATCC90586_001720 [Pythium insidiosum]|nr:hypothetical protein ATCC90586_001720 [Pythium insidiosum]
MAPGIYRARDVRTHDLVALKVYDKALLRRAATRRRMRHELRVLSRCKEHANVLRLYGVYSSRHTLEIAFELAQGGPVMHRLSSPRHRVSEREVSRVIGGVVSAVQFLHDRGIVHGEIRPEHVLYSDTEPDARVVLVDFGRAAESWDRVSFRGRARANAEPRRRTESFLWHDRHSVKFLPPFVVQRRENGVRDWREAQQLDLWAVGVTMYILLCAAFPFDGETVEEISDAIVDGPPPLLVHDSGATPLMSRAARDLLLKLLGRDPHKALTASDVLAHPWIADDVSSDVAWTADRLERHAVFARAYDMEELRAAAVKRADPLPQNQSDHQDRDTDREAVDGGDGNDDGALWRETSERAVLLTPTAEESDDGALLFDPEAERPSFVSTDGNVRSSSGRHRVSSGGGGGGGGGGVSGRLSADAYMRLASAEMEATAGQFSPTAHAAPWWRQSAPDEDVTRTETEATPPPMGDFWPVFSKQRRLFSFKNLSFLSSKGEDSNNPKA